MAKVSAGHKSRVSFLKAHRAEIKAALPNETDPKRRRQMQSAIDKIDRAEAKAFPILLVFQLLAWLVPLLLEWFKKES